MRKYIVASLFLVCLSGVANSAFCAYMFTGVENSIVAPEAPGGDGVRTFTLTGADVAYSYGRIGFEARGNYMGDFLDPDYTSPFVQFELDNGEWSGKVTRGEADYYEYSPALFVRDTLRHFWTIPEVAMRGITSDGEITVKITSTHEIFGLNPLAQVEWAILYNEGVGEKPPEVPIPSAALLLTTGMIGMVGFRKMFNKS